MRQPRMRGGRKPGGSATSIDLIKALYRERPHATLHMPFCKVRDVLERCHFLASTDGLRLSAAVAYTEDSIEFAWALPGRAETLRNLIVQARHRLKQVSYLAVMETGSRSWSQVLDLPILGRYYRSCFRDPRPPEVNLPRDFSFVSLDPERDAGRVTDIIHRAYPSLRRLVTAEQLQAMAKLAFYQPEHWFFLRHDGSGETVGVALGGFCSEMEEGFIDWVEVVPRFRGRGLGRCLILESIRHLCGSSRFITWTGSLDAPFVVGDLYKHCGFTRTRQWTVLGEGTRSTARVRSLFVPPPGLSGPPSGSSS